MKLLSRYSLYLAFFFALASMVGSLFFSDVLKYPPCILCWYQRICMYPIVSILGVGIYSKDRHVYRYVFPPVLLGIIIAFYHNLLYYKILPESVAPCQLGISCTTKYIEYFGFITIPFLSFVGFALILIFMLLYQRKLRLEKYASERKNI